MKRVGQQIADRAAGLRALGYAAYRAGNPGPARRHFERALALFRNAHGPAHAETLTAYSDLGAACAALGDTEAARAAHEMALQGRRLLGQAGRADLAASLHNLAAIYRRHNDPAAEACQAEAAAIWQEVLGPTHPLVARALAGLGALARDRSDAEAARRLALQVLHIQRSSAALEDLGLALDLGGDHDGAARAWAESLAMLRASGGASTGVARLLSRLGAVHRNRNALEQAAACFAEAIEADASLIMARHHLAVLLSRLGQAEQASRHRDIALAQQSHFVEAGRHGARSVLILSLAGMGNVPLEQVLPAGDFTRIWWFPAHADARGYSGLPPYDLVFNGAGDPDMLGPEAVPLAAFLRRCDKPILNLPAGVAATRRDRLPATLAGIDGIEIPPTLRMHGAPTHQAIAASGLKLPVLLRPVGAHGGQGLVRIDAWVKLDTLAYSAWYVTPFRDYRSQDGFFRKYRVVFAAGIPLPYHLAISPDWLVHYRSADMADHSWKLAEEAAFLDHPEAALGGAGWAALTAIGRRIGLDYFGIDFTALPDGRLLVFEANATMLIHTEAEDSALSFKNRYVQAITDAMRQHVTTLCRG